MNRRYGKLDLDWGAFAAVYFDIASSLNLNLELTSPECSVGRGVDTWVLKWVLTLLLPVFAGATVVVVGALFYAASLARLPWFGSKTRSELVASCARTFFQILVLLYLPLTGAAFALFGCRKDATDRWVLDDDPVRSCYTSSWWGLFPIGFAAVVGYAVLLPAGVVWMLRSKRAELDPLTYVLRYGFLVGRFEDRAWFFEAAIMVRKLGVVLCMTFFFTDEGKANAGVVVLAAALGHLIFFQPYVARYHDVLAVVVLSATGLVLYAGTFVDFTLRRVGVVIGIVVNVLAILVGNGYDLYRIAVSEKEVEDEEFYVGGVVRMSGVGDDGGVGGGGGEYQMTSSVELDDMLSSQRSSSQVAVVSTVSVFADGDSAAGLESV